MPNLPQSTADRLTLLERDAVDVQQAARLRDRVAGWVWPRAVYRAITAEDLPDGDYDPYPTSGHVLPITFVNPVIDNLNRLTWQPRTPVPRQTTLAPLWLPPKLLIDISWDGRRYQAVRWPTLVHGRCTQAPVGAVWYTDSYGDVCGQHVSVVGEMHVYWREFPTAPGLDVPQYYRDGSPVLMPVWNTAGGAITVGKFLSVSPDPWGRWCIVVEPCGTVCP